MVGSIQCRSSPTSASRPSSRAISNQSTNSSRHLACSSVVQHRIQAGRMRLGAAVQPARRRLEPRAGIGLQLGALVVHLLAQQRAPAAPAARRCASGRATRLAHRRQHVVAHRLRFGFQRIESVASLAARPHMVHRPRRETLRPARAARRRSRCVQPSPASAPAACTASSSASCACSSSAIRSLSRSSSPRMRVRARPSGPADPAAQFRHLAARQQRRRSR